MFGTTKIDTTEFRSHFNENGKSRHELKIKKQDRQIDHQSFNRPLHFLG